MGRINPNSDTTPNPSTRWHEWNGGSGKITYYDKSLKQDCECPLPFSFLLLDQLSAVKGWHDASESGIYSNEVRDTRQEALVVRAFKGGELASGIYQSIRDRIGRLGGHYVASIYIAVKDADKLVIANLQLKGAALNEWVEFTKANKADIYKKAIVIRGFKTGKKGQVTYYTPEFSLKDVSAETDESAGELQAQLASYLSEYLKRPKVEAATPLAQKDESHVEDVAADEHAAREEFKDEILF